MNENNYSNNSFEDGVFTQETDFSYNTSETRNEQPASMETGASHNPGAEEDNLFSEERASAQKSLQESETILAEASAPQAATETDEHPEATPKEAYAAASAPAKKPAIQPSKRRNPALLLAACAALSLLCGFGGATLAIRGFNVKGPSVIYTASSSGSSKIASVSSNGETMTITEAAEKASPSVVEVQVEITQTSYGFFGGTYASTGAGSGVIITSDGYIVTNNHVVKDATAISITTYDGKTYDATLVGTDEKSDIAVIKVDASDLMPATIGDSTKIRVGETALVIGNPLGTLGGTVTSGIISAISREVVIDRQSMELIQTNAAINSGNSGGGLFDGNGNLIGIVNSKDSGTTSSGAIIEGLGFAIPSNTALDVAQQLIENGKVTNRATLGVYLQELTSGNQYYAAGLYISDIISGSGAEEAGLQPYDRIVTADNTEVSDYTGLSAVLRNKKPGDNLELVIVRDGKTMTVNVTLTGTLE